MSAHLKSISGKLLSENSNSDYEDILIENKITTGRKNAVRKRMLLTFNYKGAFDWGAFVVSVAGYMILWQLKDKTKPFFCLRKLFKRVFIGSIIPFPLVTKLTQQVLTDTELTRQGCKMNNLLMNNFQ